MLPVSPPSFMPDHTTTHHILQTVVTCSKCHNTAYFMASTFYRHFTNTLHVDLGSLMILKGRDENFIIAEVFFSPNRYLLHILQSPKVVFCLIFDPTSLFHTSLSWWYGKQIQFGLCTFARLLVNESYYENISRRCLTLLLRMPEPD